MELNVQIGRGQAQFLTDFFAGEFQPLPHQKQAPLDGRQFVGAGIQYLKELTAADVLLGISPIGGHFREMAVGFEYGAGPLT